MSDGTTAVAASSAVGVSEELSWRAKYRLRLAASLLASKGKPLSLDRAQFYPQMLAVIAGMSAADQAELRARVDWIEAFDPEDALSASARNRAR